jgi:hypothetical protein
MQRRHICNDEDHHYLMEESELTLEEELELSGHFQKNGVSSSNPEIKGQDAGRHKNVLNVAYNAYLRYLLVQRYTCVRYFRAPILNFLLFHSYLCLKIKVLALSETKRN